MHLRIASAVVIVAMAAGCGLPCDCPELAPQPLKEGTYVAERVSKIRTSFPPDASDATPMSMSVNREANTVEVRYNVGATAVVERWRVARRL